MEGFPENSRPHIRYITPNLTECDLDWRSHRRWLPSPRYGDAPFPHIKDAKFPQDIRLQRAFPQANKVSEEEWTLYPGFKQRRVQASCDNKSADTRHFTLEAAEPFRAKKKKSPLTCHAVIGARPYQSPEYSPGFYKCSSTFPLGNSSSKPHVKPDTFIPLQVPNKPCLPYIEKKRLQERQEEIQEVKRLGGWKPVEDIFK